MICWRISIQSYETIIFFSNLWDHGSTLSLRAVSQWCYHLLVMFIWVSYCNVIVNGDFSNNIIFPYVEMAFYKQYHPTLYTHSISLIFFFYLEMVIDPQNIAKLTGESLHKTCFYRAQNQEIDVVVIGLDGLWTWLELHTFTFLILLWFSPYLWYYNLLSLQFFLLLTLS